MKKLYSLLLLATALTANAQQIPNGNFESEWENFIPFTNGKYSNNVGKTPKGWKVSNTAGMGTLGKKILGYEVNTAHSGNSAVEVKNLEIALGNIGPGYVTLGTPWNTSVGTWSISGKDGGSFGGIDFKYKPDALQFWYKRSVGSSNVRSSVIAYIWNGSVTQTNVPVTNASKSNGLVKYDMVDRDIFVLRKDAAGHQGDAVTTNGTKLIASLEEYTTEEVSEWTKGTYKFKYDPRYKNETPSKLNIIFAASDYFNSSNVTKDVALDIDDVTLVYYKYLSKLTINGSTPSDFVGDETADNTNKVTIDASNTEYTEGCVVAEAAGVGASTTTSYNPLTAVYTIVVTAGDGAQKVYEINFKQVYNAAKYTNSLLVHFGEYFPISQNDIYLLSHKEKEQYGFVLEKFEFMGENMGMIYVKDLAKKVNADESVTYSNSEPELVYIEGLGEEVPVLVNATVSNDNQMTATITIPLDGTEDGTVIVTYGPQLTINPSTSLEVSNAKGLTNVVMNRTFAAGWNTYCMPFDYNLSSLSAEAKAQEFVSSNGSSLTFNEVADGVLKANVPYLVYFPTETTVGTTEAPLYFVTNVASYQPTSVEHNGFTFVGNYEASKSMNGLYGVASEGDVQKIMLGTDGSTLPATCAYFTTKNLNANGLRICFDGGEVTGINQVNGAQAQSAGAVYNLQGIKVSNHGTNNLPAGLYIMQGKKVIVK